MDFLDSLNSLGSVPGLTSIKELLHRLDNPETGVKVIHIAGTNGKGSTGAFIDSILCTAGFVTGRYVSPAVEDPLEIIRISGHNIDSDNFNKIIYRVKKSCEDMVRDGFMHPTRFEVETAAAILFFAEKNVDYAIVECGMGGLYDATNVFDNPVCSVITPVSYDHMQFLGNSLTEIAVNKAGIIKEGCPVVTSKQPKEVMDVLEKTAKECSCELILADCDKACNIEYRIGKFDYKGINGLQTGLKGTYQIENAITAIECVRTITNINEEDIRAGLLNAKWNGRFEIVKGRPEVILDGAHNPAGAKALAESLKTFYPMGNLTYIIGVFADKDYKTVLEHTIKYAGRVITIETPDNPRALSCEVLADFIKKNYDISVYACKKIKDAVKLAYEITEQDSAIVAFGSLSHLSIIKGEINGR